MAKPFIFQRTKNGFEERIRKAINIYKISLLVFAYFQSAGIIAYSFFFVKSMSLIPAFFQFWFYYSKPTEFVKSLRLIL